MFNRKPYPYKERVVNVHYIYYAKNLAVIIPMLVDDADERINMPSVSVVVSQSVVLQWGLSETHKDKNSSSPNISLLNGHMPLAANPDLIFLVLMLARLLCQLALPHHKW